MLNTATGKMTRAKILPPFDNRTSQKNLLRRRATNCHRLFFDSSFLAWSRRRERWIVFLSTSSQLPVQFSRWCLAKNSLASSPFCHRSVLKKMNETYAQIRVLSAGRKILSKINKKPQFTSHVKTQVLEWTWQNKCRYVRNVHREQFVAR